MQFLKYPDSLYINGKWVKTSDTSPIINPADETLVENVALGSKQNIDEAIAAARDAFDNGPWPRISQKERQAKLTQFVDAIESRKELILKLIMVEAGASQIVANAGQYLIPMQHARHMINISSRPSITPLPVETTPMPNGSIMLGAGVMSREPMGVVAAITPYNFPFFLNISKIIPAMAVGCTVVLKPSPYTPMEALILGEIADEVGLPAGVLNIVTGDIEAGQLLTTDKRIDLVSFTGSDKVGEAIQAQAASTLKRCLLELGGKSALIIREDADLNAAVMSGLRGFTWHCGQGCALLTRHIVHNSIRAKYVEALKAATGQIKIGNPIDPTVNFGPLIRDVAVKRSQNYVDIALSEGAKLVTGGKKPAHLDKGFYFEPTLFDEVQNNFRIAQEEVFGPIGVVIGFDNDEEAIKMANDSDFGLSGGIFSNNVGKAYEMALQLRTGGVAINGGSGKMSSYAPFGGIKRSGYGREYGEEGLNEFTYIKTIGFHGA